MVEVEVISAKEAAVQAGVHSAQVYDAIDRGLLRAKRSDGRVFILKASFTEWVNRLVIKRKMRSEEQEELART
jgi:hypothetical protein